MVKEILKIFGGGLDLAKLIVGKSDRKDRRKYLDEYLDAEKKVLNAELKVEQEKEKPADKQFSNVIEHFEKSKIHWEKKAKLLQEVAHQEYLDKQVEGAK